MHWFIVAGFIQSVFLSFFMLFTERGNVKANRLMSFYFLAISVFLIIPEVLRQAAANWPHLFAISYPILFLIGPSLYYYKRILLQEQHFNKPIEFLHIVPAFCTASYLSGFYAQSSLEKLEFYKTVKSTGLPFDFWIIWFIACIHIIVYQLATLISVRQYNRLTEEYFSRLESVRVRWLEKFILMNSILWIFYFFGYVLMISGVENNAWGYIDQAFAALVSIFIYYLSFIGLNKPEIFPGPILPALRKFSADKNSIEKQKKLQLITTLKNMMENDKPYLQPDLSLSSLANLLKVSPRLLSQLMHEEYNQNFFEFINHYRVLEAKKRLADPVNNNLTLAAIAQASGFNSKSTFNEVFKKIENITPSKFKSHTQGKL
jgi:AraC-like DNA-binding protein